LPPPCCLSLGAKPSSINQDSIEEVASQMDSFLGCLHYLRIIPFAPEPKPVT
jgi:hypothetical protein